MHSIGWSKTDPWQEARGWLEHPTKNMLVRAQICLESKNTLIRHVDARLWTITAVAIGTIEALGRTVAAAGLMGLWTLHSTVCMLLRGTFLLTWLAIGYLSNQALDKSLIRWVQFLVLQVLLSYTNPGNWWAQWKLWARVMRGMGDFANSAAATADQIDKKLEDVAAWSRVMDHVSRTASLAFFSISSVFFCFRPEKVFRNYNKSVEELPDRRSIHVRVGSCLQRNWGLVTSIGVVALAAYAHYHTPGFEDRAKFANHGAKGLWALGSWLTMSSVTIVESVHAITLAKVVRYFSDSPDYISFNELVQKMNIFIKMVAEKQLQDNSQGFCPATDAPPRIFG